MSARKVILVLVVSNACFASALYFRSNTKTVPQAEEQQRAGRPRTIVKRVESAPEIITSTHWQKIDWTAVESPEYPRYIANLRAIKCPEETIRDIIVADVNKLYASKWRALHPSTGWKFWEGDRKKSDKEARHSDDRRELEEERAELIKELLGVDLKTELKKYAWDTESGGDRRYSFLPETKQTGLRDLDSSYKDSVRELLEEARNSGESKEAVEAKLAALKKQHQADIAAMLSPYELEEYQLRNSNLADRMRKDLGMIEPTEQEFRNLFKTLSADIDPATGQLKNLNWNDPQIQSRLADAFGQERASQLAALSDPEFQKTAKLVEKMGGTIEDASRVLAINQASDQAIAEALNNPALSKAERAAAVDAIKKEQRAILTSTLGSTTKKKKLK